MTDHDLELRFQAACAVAREAGKLAKRYFDRRDEIEIEHKGTQDLVSIADKETEALIRARLGQAFPDDVFVGEEGGADAVEGAAGVWVIDPIDGTMNFLRGVPYWSLVIAYVRGRETLIGITYDPTHDELFAARQGGGATRDGRPIRVSGQTDPRQAALGHTYSFKLDPERYVRTVGKLLEAGADHRRLGSTALMLGHVADGRLDGIVTLYASAWDVLAGLLLVREAGGVTSDWFAHASLTETSGVYACTPSLAPVIEAASGLKP